MEQLSGADTLLVFGEQGNVHNHISGLCFYDMASVPGGTLRFRNILTHFERRLPVTKAFRRRLVTVPHGVDRPYWVSDADVDIEFHVRHIAVPHPGDWRQLMILVARLHSQALDLGKPLWEVYVIEGLEKIPGLPPSCFAVLYKFHAAVLDGQAIGEIVRDVHTAAPRDDGAPPADVALISEPEPRALELYVRAVGHHARRGARLASLYGRTLKALASDGSRALLSRVTPSRRQARAERMPLFSRAPECRFNAAVSPARVVEAVDFGHDDIAAIRVAVSHVGVNDILLATLSGALRLYLKGKGELPAESLRALVPYAIRKPGFAGAAGPGASGLPVGLCTDLREPLQRLHAVHDAQCAARHGRTADVGRELLPELVDGLPSRATHELLRLGLLGQVNCIASHLNGPRQPVYLAGARALRIYPLGRIADHAALNVSAVSYDGRIWLSVVACRDTLPDPAHFAECLKTAFDELRRAALTPRARKASRRQAA